MINSHEATREYPSSFDLFKDFPKKLGTLLIKKWKKVGLPKRSLGQIIDSIEDLLTFWNKPNVSVLYQKFRFTRQEYSEMYSYAFKNYANNWLNNLRQWNLLHTGLEKFETEQDILSNTFRFTYALSMNLVKSLISLHPAHHLELNDFLKVKIDCFTRKLKILSEDNVWNILIDKITFEIVYEFMTKDSVASAVKLPGFQGLYTPEKAAFLLNSQSLCRLGGRNRMERVIYTYATKFKETFSCDTSTLVNFAECPIFE